MNDQADSQRQYFSIHKPTIKHKEPSKGNLYVDESGNTYIDGSLNNYTD